MNILIKDILTVQPDDVKTCSVYISDGVIKSVGAEPEGFAADKTIFGAGKMLIPGLINAHTHATMSILRNCADDLLFDDWLFGRILPLEDKFIEDDYYWGSTLSIMEMLRTGTTTFIDMYFYLDVLVRAVDDSGIRAVISRGLIDPGDISAGEERLAEALEAYERHKNHKRVSFMLAPHAPYTCSVPFQKIIAEEAKRLNLPIHTHISEGLVEKENIREQYGCTSVELMDRNGLIHDKTIAAHCVHLSDNDIKIMAERGATVVTNPVSNLKLANGVAPVPKMLKAGINVALGTDGAASNNTLNMFRELTMLSIIHKGINHDALAVTAAEGFAIATKGGAKAMGRDDIGEIKPGNVADLVILDLDCPNMQPVNNPMSSLAYSTYGTEVETVMVAGKILMENREFLTIDSDKVYHEVSKICDRIGTR